jgi:hypothetical protein
VGVIDDASKILRHLFVHEVPDLRVPGAQSVLPAQVRFDTPDDTFTALRGSVMVDNGMATVEAPVLNVSLVDLRENRTLRSNERVRVNGSDPAIDNPAPARVDCHYLITAWVPGDPTLSHEPALLEQALLHQVLVALFQNAPLNAARLSPPLTGLPALIADTDLPTTVAPIEGFAQLGEFWSAMTTGARRLPAVYLVLTVPVAFRPEVTGPLVTTKTTSFDVDAEPETFVQIGGVLLDQQGNPVPGAWVRLETQLGVALAVTGSDTLGRFKFDGLRAGSYKVRARATGLGATEADMTVPSLAGGYEVKF